MKRKFINILSAVILASIVFSTTFVYSGCEDFFGDTKDVVNKDQIEQYIEMADSHAHFSNDYIQGVPFTEIEYRPVDGVDYSSYDISDAFNSFYENADAYGSDIITDNNAVYDGTDDAPEFTKREEPQKPGVPKPVVYSGGADTHQAVDDPVYSSGDSAEMSRKVLNDPQTWVDLGNTIVEYIEFQRDDFVETNLYDELSDPDTWIEISVDIIEMINEIIEDDPEYFEYDGEFAPDLLSEMIGALITESITEFVEEELGDSYIDFDELEQVTSDAMLEKIDKAGTPDNNSGDNPGNSGGGSVDMSKPKTPASDFVINYTIAGRQMYREILSKKQQRAYDIMATAVQRGQFELYVDFGITNDEADNVLLALKNDHPEFFFVIGYAFGPVDRDGMNVEFMEFLLDDDIMKIGVDKALKEITAKAAPVIAAAKNLRSDIEKVKYIADYLCEVNSYELNAFANQGIYSSIVTNKTVCAGYASAFHYYMNFLGVETTRVNSCFHQWNLLILDGDYYYMDVTWIDTPSYGERDGAFVEMPVSYEWFNFNRAKVDEFGKESDSTAHKRDFIAQKLPEANGTKYSYANWYGDPMKESSSATTSPDSTAENNTTTTDDSGTTQKPTETKPTVPDITDEPYIPDVTDEPYIPDDPDEPVYNVTVNGEDISDKLTVMKIGDVLYAEGKSFIESVRDSDMPEDMRYYNFDYSNDYDYIYDNLTEYDFDRGVYLDDDFAHLIGKDAIFIWSWATDTIIYVLFIDSTDIVKSSADGAFSYYKLQHISKAPRIVDGEVYIPIEAFLGLSEHNDFEIRHN